MARVTAVGALLAALATGATATPSRLFPRHAKETPLGHAEVGGLYGWSPMPTPAPMGPPADVVGMERRYEKGSDTCGFAEGFKSDPWTCFALGATCSVWSGYMACCATTGTCTSTVLTRCVNWSDVQSGSCSGADGHTLCCTNSYPSCFTWTSTTSTDPSNTMTGFNCLATGGTGELFEQPPELTMTTATSTRRTTTSDTSDTSDTATDATGETTSDATATSDPNSTSAAGSNSNNNNNGDSSSGSSTPVGAIVGGVVGGLAAIALVILAVAILIRKRRASAAIAPPPQPPMAYNGAAAVGTQQPPPPPMSGHDPHMSMMPPPQGDPYNPHNNVNSGYYPLPTGSPGAGVVAGGYYNDPSKVSPSMHSNSLYSSVPGQPSPPPPQGQSPWPVQHTGGSMGQQQYPPSPHGPQELSSVPQVGSTDNRAELL